jgi:hypothetical protein
MPEVASQHSSIMSLVSLYPDQIKGLDFILCLFDGCTDCRVTKIAVSTADNRSLAAAKELRWCFFSVKRKIPVWSCLTASKLSKRIFHRVAFLFGETFESNLVKRGEIIKIEIASDFEWEIFVFSRSSWLMYLVLHCHNYAILVDK